MKATSKTYFKEEEKAIKYVRTEIRLTMDRIEAADLMTILRTYEIENKETAFGEIAGKIFKILENPESKTKIK